MLDSYLDRSIDWYIEQWRKGDKSTMEMYEFAQKIHENAKAHGWWDGERNAAEVFSLFHSELSEALEEDRARRPMVWFQCMNWNQVLDSDAHCLDDGRQDVACVGQGCCKPEGIAVELADFCIRILDAVIEWNLSAFGRKVSYGFQEYANMPLPVFIAHLHQVTSRSFSFAQNDVNDAIEYRENVAYWLTFAFRMVEVWLQAHGYDLMEVMQMKHKYNLSRPYKHGKKF